MPICGRQGYSTGEQSYSYQFISTGRLMAEAIRAGFVLHRDICAIGKQSKRSESNVSAIYVSVDDFRALRSLSMCFPCTGTAKAAKPWEVAQRLHVTS
jgi:hypothetical protein